MILEDYKKTGKIYHIVSLFDLKTALKKGIMYNDKITYDTKYKGFHDLFQTDKPEKVPEWVDRNKAIFASMNYEQNHCFHSNSAVLGIKIDPTLCWVANENLANILYAPFVLKKIKEFKGATNYIEERGSEIIKKYWSTSLSFEDNLVYRKDKKEGYNAEVLVMHDINPQDIEVESIFTGYEMMNPSEWQEKYCN
jgi:hypothetical protein